MSLAQKLFGGGGGKGQPKREPTSHEAIQKLRETEEMLNKKTEYLEEKMNEQLTIAKKAGTKNKRGRPGITAIGNVFGGEVAE